MKKFYFAILILLTISPFHNAVSQDEGARITTDSGVELHIPSGMDYIIDNPTGPNTIFNIFPPRNQEGGLAKANIIDGSEITQLSAKKIVFKLSSEEYVLEDQAKIVQGKDILIGPVKIEYLPNENKMVSMGSANNPASFTYYLRNQTKPIETKARELHFFFKEVNGKNQLIQIKAVSNDASRFPMKSQSGSTPGLSGD